MKMKKQPPQFCDGCIGLQIEFFKSAHTDTAGQDGAQQINDCPNGKYNKLQAELFSSLCVQKRQTGQVVQHFSNGNDQECRNAVDQKRDANLIGCFEKTADKKYVECSENQKHKPKIIRRRIH